MRHVLAATVVTAVMACPALAQPPQSLPPSDQAPAAPTQNVAEAPPTVQAGQQREVTRTVEGNTITTTEVIAPVRARPPLDPDNPIAPEVKQVVATGSYSTADLVQAQLEAIRATPPTQPTTIITTTVTQPPGDTGD